MAREPGSASPEENFLTEMNTLNITFFFSNQHIYCATDPANPRDDWMRRAAGRVRGSSLPGATRGCARTRFSGAAGWRPWCFTSGWALQPHFLWLGSGAPSAPGRLPRVLEPRRRHSRWVSLPRAPHDHVSFVVPCPQPRPQRPEDRTLPLSARGFSRKFVRT